MEQSLQVYFASSLIAPIIGIVFLIILFFLMVKSVPQSENWTVERFKKYSRTLKPGLKLIFPILESIGHRVNMMERVLNIGSQEVITKDNATIEADAIAFFQVTEAEKASYEVQNLQTSLENIIQTNIRSVIGSMDLDASLSNRETINSRLLNVIDEAVKSWGVKVTRIEIKDLKPPPDITDAMAGQMKAEREKRAEVLQAEGEKQAAILRAEGLKVAQILEAEGRKEAAFLDAEAREREARAEAKATEMVSESIRDGNHQALNYFVAQKYTKALESVASAPNSKTVMIPLEAGSLIGSIAGIAELAKGATQKNNT